MTNQSKDIIRNPYFDNCPDRRNESESHKWRRYPADILPMWVADMDCTVAPEIQQALVKRIEHGVFGYGRALPELYDVLCERMEKKYQWSIDPEWIKFTAGVVMGFNQYIDATSKPGDAILLQTPAYPPILETPSYRKLDSALAPLVRSADGRYEIDFDIFEKAITPQTKYFLFCNPQNPTGRVFTKAEIEKIAEICLRHNLIILSDEIHQDIVFSGHQHTPIASLSKEVENRTITFSAGSKTYNIAGLKCSYAIIPNKEMREEFDRGGEGLVDSVSVLGLTATTAAFRYGDEWLKNCLSYLEANRDYVVSEVAKIDGITTYAPEGTFLAWLDCSGLDLACSPQEFFYNKARIAFNDGATFGNEYQNFIRMNYGCSMATLEKAFKAMKQALTDKQG